MIILLKSALVSYTWRIYDRWLWSEREREGERERESTSTGTFHFICALSEHCSYASLHARRSIHQIEDERLKIMTKGREGNTFVCVKFLFLHEKIQMPKYELHERII